VVGGLLPGYDAVPRIAHGDGSAPPLHAGASVQAPSCMLADALTKIVLLTGDPAHPLLAAHGACTWLYRDGKLPAAPHPAR
jgi:thiamine biosynthesis lipoprotein